jgi:hypothetical protein
MLSRYWLGSSPFSKTYCCCVLVAQMDVTKFWKDIHHPRSPRAPYFTSMLGPSAGVSAGSVYDAAVQYMQSVGHKQGVSVV